MSNTAIWDTLGKTDPAHTKGFKRAGGFSGTAIKPIWMIRRLTELFGPVGMGWGYGKPEFQLVPAGEELLVYCTLEAWHTTDSNVFYGVGGDKVITKNKYGLSSDDEAFKKAFTDALGNAFKHLGSGADVHMGQFDDSKYVRSLEREFANDEAAGGQSGDRAVSPPPAKPKAHSALKTAYRQFVHEANGCGDADELAAFLATPDALKVVREVREKLPHIWDGSDWPEDQPRPEEWEPLADFISRRQRECAEATAQYLTA